MSDKKLSLVALVLMIFTSVFGFANMPRSFYLMGYAAIPWYVLSAFTFFIPFALMTAEFGSAFKNEKGGIYSWMEKSVGGKFAFVGTFMWFASYVVWMVNICNAIWIPFANAIFGGDTTQSWSLFGLTYTHTLGILGVCWIVSVTFIASRGLGQIAKVTSIGGTACALLNIVLLVGAIAVVMANGGHLAQPISADAFFDSPNPKYHSIVNIFSFLVFAIFAYGGIEAVGGLVDKTDNPEKTFPKGLVLSALIISVGYSLGILMCGFFVDWQAVMSGKTVHLGNVAYVALKHLGYQVGHSFGMADASAIELGKWMARYVGFSMFLCLTGAFFTLCYAPLKQLIEGTPAELWPKFLSESKDGMPVNAMWVQCGIVVAFILLVTFGGEAASEFFAKLVLMTNVAMTLPYMFISIAFPYFKKKTEIEKPFVVFKSYDVSLWTSIVVTFTVGFANFFTIIEPAVNGDIASTIWSIAGPGVFTIIALVMWSRYENKMKRLPQQKPGYSYTE